MASESETYGVSCARCRSHLGHDAEVAAISGSVMGDEITDTYFLCPHCQVFTVELLREAFCGPESVTITGPIERVVGEARVALIDGCASPWDKHCRCESHKAYFAGHLD